MCHIGCQDGRKNPNLCRKYTVKTIRKYNGICIIFKVLTYNRSTDFDNCPILDSFFYLSLNGEGRYEERAGRLEGKGKDRGWGEVWLMGRHEEEKEGQQGVGVHRRRRK